jgi:small-conductance mechanosensitive channel
VSRQPTRVAGLAALALTLAAPAAWAAQAVPPTAAAPQTAAAPDPEADVSRPAAVLVGGEPILWITAGTGPYTTEFRAGRISGRLDGIVRDRALRTATVVVTEVDGSSELRVGSQLVMVVTQRDAASLGTSRASLAQQYARVFEEAIRAERLRYAPATLIRSGILGLLATLVFAVTVWTIVRLTRALRRPLTARLASRTTALDVLQEEVLAGGRLTRLLTRTILAVRIVLILVAFNLYLSVVLGLFPWTRPVSRRLFDYAYTPVRTVVAAFAGYLPNLLFVVVIAGMIYVAIRLVGAFFRSIEQGRLAFARFPSEWADPTNKIARVLLVAFGLVVAFPYLPASDSPAFAGVSVFIGVLVSLSSSSALSNMIAGIVMTYTGAFRIGDRVKLGDAFGDIIATTLLATRVRTIKNEEVTIPNSVVIGSAVTNYTREAATRGLILHTTVTIGYDTPWRTIHGLLIEAARGTPGILAEPAPFVWQTALNDFYVSYEINAYTASASEMIDIYAALHARIQDTFYAAGVEIMSPHYTSIRDGNTIAIPEASRGPGYEPGGFRVETRHTERPLAVPGGAHTPGQ